jgi:hypothetical protein
MMPQMETDHTPLSSDHLSWNDQVLIRLDEIIGLLDSVSAILSVSERSPLESYTIGSTEDEPPLPRTGQC